MAKNATGKARTAAYVVVRHNDTPTVVLHEVKPSLCARLSQLAGESGQCANPARVAFGREERAEVEDWYLSSSCSPRL